MNRTYERILFMLIGACIAFVGYLVGNINTGANADLEQTMKDAREQGYETPYYERLYVKHLNVGNTIFIGDSNKHNISMGSNPESTSFCMSRMNPDGYSKTIIFNMDKERAWFNMMTKIGIIKISMSDRSKTMYVSGANKETQNSFLMGLANRHSKIELRDSKGRKLIGTR